MARISALVRIARESEMSSVIETEGELIGADSIDKDILENNIMAVDMVTEDLEAIKDATRDAKDLDDISTELANESETLTPFAAKMVHARIRQLAEPYGERIRGFSKESFDRTTANRMLAREAEEAAEGIKDKIKAAWGRLKEKAKEIKDRLFKNMDYLNKRVAQLQEMAGQMGEGTNENFKFKSPIGDFNKALKEMAYVAKGGTFVKEANSAIKALEKVAQYDGDEYHEEESAEERTVLTVPEESAKLFPGHFTINVNKHGVIVGYKVNKDGKPAEATELPQLSKKEVAAMLLNASKVLGNFKTEAQKFTEVMNTASAVEVKHPKKDVEVFYAAMTLANYVDAVVRKVVNEATRYIEASIKAAK